MTTRTYNGFTYVGKIVNGLKTTDVYFKGQLFEVRKEFTCLECLKDVELIYKPDITIQQAKFMDRLHHEVLCKDCIKVTDEQIKGAAEKLQEVLWN